MREAGKIEGRLGKWKWGEGMEERLGQLRAVNSAYYARYMHDLDEAMVGTRSIPEGVCKGNNIQWSCPCPWRFINYLQRIKSFGPDKQRPYLTLTMTLRWESWK
jgi:hypothetical protein